MSDVFLFMEKGWKNIWKQRNIWLFSALPVLDQLLNFVQIPHTSILVRELFALTEILISIVLYFTGITGVMYLVYCSSIGKSVSIGESFLAIRKFFGRVVGCSCLGVLIVFPLMWWALGISIIQSTYPDQISSRVALAFLPLSLFTAVWEFTVFEFFVNDQGISQSARNAWALFAQHFGVLMTVGMILAMIFRIYSAVSGALVVLTQSGFDLLSLSKLDYFDPAATLNNNVLFVLISGICQIIFIPFGASTFAAAFLEYGGTKKVSLDPKGQLD